jgi:hypothetical protein
MANILNGTTKNYNTTISNPPTAYPGYDANLSIGAVGESRAESTSKVKPENERQQDLK